MKAVFLAPQALADLEEILDYIAQDNPHAALRWVDYLEDQCDSLGANPKRGPKRDELRQGVRVLPVRGYLIFYRETVRYVEVITIVHGARDPQFIAERIQNTI